MIPSAFDYLAPKTIAEATALLAEHGDDAKILAGGQSLIPAMRFRLAAPAILVDINGIPDLGTIRSVNGHLSIGALTRELDLEESAEIASGFSMLADAARVIADPLVRGRATIGGNLAHADPANDHPAVMLAYGAEVHVTSSAGGARVIPIDDFFTDMFTTSMQPDELMTELRIPRPGAGSGGAYLKIERKVGDYAISAVAVQLSMSGDICTSARIALTNVNPVPMRVPEAERLLVGQRITDELLEAAGQAAARACDPSADLRGSVEYKRDLTRIIVKRAVRKAVERAGA
jgi:carbon-monoxide dehydrogenase medium subunit